MKQMTPQEAIDKLTALCPCEIRYVDLGANIYGCVVYDKPSYIEISDQHTLAQQAATLSHEVGHVVCSTSNCKCDWRRQFCSGSTQLGEFHANLFSMRWLLVNCCLFVLEIRVCRILALAAWPFTCSCDNLHSDAATRIMETKLWQKCLAACDIEQEPEFAAAAPELILAQ